jgi:hypothetical protein
MEMDIGGFSSTGSLPWILLYRNSSRQPRPHTDEITLSLLSRAKACKYSVLVLTVDTSMIGWRPNDLANSYLPTFHGYGAQIGISDPEFMSRHGKQPIVGSDNQPTFPYDSAKLDRMMETDRHVKEMATLGTEWLKEFQGPFRTWEDLKLLKENWDGPLVLKGIQSPEVSSLPICSTEIKNNLSRMQSGQSIMVQMALLYPIMVNLSIFQLLSDSYLFFPRI